MAENSENKIEHASLNLPKGGGAINGIGEKFQANVATGTGGYSIPLPISPGRSGFAPSLGLSYDSGGGNSPFGLGWNVAVPSITRKTNKELPQYNDIEESDTFLLAGAEDLVPTVDSSGNREKFERVEEGVTYEIFPYRPRIEGLFAKIERWVTQGISHWRVTTKEGTTSRYGLSFQSRIADPSSRRNVFKWLLEDSFDLYGNRIRYEYKEDEIVFNEYRSATNKYLKRVHYSPFSEDDQRFHFQLVFDYGEHNESIDETHPWSEREDAFSSYRSGFEIRTARRCENVLMFHNFPDAQLDQWELVKKLSLTFDSSAVSSYLTKATIWGIKGDERKALPPLEFTYSRAEIDSVIKQIDSESLKNVPVGLDNRRWQWIDVYGEGIPGIAVRDGGTVLYKENLGDGKFGPLHTVAEFPNLSSSDSITLSDIDGDGNNEFTVKADGINGYYRFRKDHWEPFTPITHSPNIDMNNPNQKMIDLTGDGRADILITEDRVMRWYPSKGEEGYEESLVTPKPTDENRGPALVFADALESIYTADMSGDGLTDIVRIRNGEVAYWPNEGHGKFGAKVTMKNSPLLESATHAVKQQYIKLGDIDGSGTTDLLYFGNGKVQYWFNESGNGFCETHELPSFPPVDSLSSISLIDLKGTGTMSLVWSSNRPGQSEMQLSYIDLMRVKPHLMVQVENNMGNRTTFHYESSVKQYLKDKENCTPWITKLHFPVHVLKQVTTEDLIGKVSQSAYYTYRHGYFDSHEREFRGFGAVETIDTKSFEEYTQGGGTEEYVAPILTKQWFHTGGFDFDSMSKQYENEYYQGDTEEFRLPDTVIEDRKNLTTDELIEAYRALKSSSLRSEVYEVGKPDPYSVSETNGVVRMLQQKGINSHAVFLPLTGESISYSYDQNKTDPRISHQFALEVDKYGVVLQSAAVIYPRRDSLDPKIIVEPQQKQTAVTLSVNKVLHRDDAEMFRIAVPLESLSYEIGNGLPITADQMVTREELKGWVDLALTPENIIPFEQEIKPGEMKARLLSWGRNFYWNSAQDAKLPHGEITKELLVHHVESARFTQKLIDDIFESRIDQDLLNESEYREDAGYFWDHGLIQHYLKADGFYLPYKTEEPDGNHVTATFDDYLMTVIQTEDANGNVSRAEEIDYRTLQPQKMIDPNDNVSEALSDALGMVIATSIQGTELRKHKDTGLDTVYRVGDEYISEYQVLENTSVEDVADNPMKYLQGATTFFYYDMYAFMDREEPLQYISVARTRHLYEYGSTDPNTTTDTVISLGYSDGFGRELQSKVKVESGKGWVNTGSGYVEQNNLIHRWLTSGRTIYNNKEKPVKQYEPFYSSSYKYEDEEFLTFGVTPVIHYDALGRVVKTDFPDGTCTAVHTTPWQIASYDQNDTDENSDHFNTPSVVTLDSLGREFLQEVYLTDYNGDTPEKLATITTFDISGNPLTVTDPRNIKAFEYRYDMAGTPLLTKNVDGGEDRIFMARFGKPLISFDTLGNSVKINYDITNRPVSTEVTAPEGNSRVNEIIHYADTVTEVNANELKDRNLRGQIWMHHEESGASVFPYYSFKGESLLKEYRLLKLNGEYDKKTDWPKHLLESSLDDVYEDDLFYTATSFDALGRVMKQVKPDLSTTIPSYHQSGTLKSVKVETLNDSEPLSYVKNIRYNAKGQRLSIEYGNSTKTTYKYNDKTYRLTELRTFRESNTNEFLQDIRYSYDAVGNITSIEDRSHQTVHTGGVEVAPISTYVYDALYRLKEAEGREKSGLNEERHSPYTELYHTAIKANRNDATAVQKFKRLYSYDEGNNLTQIEQTLGNTFTRKIVISKSSNRGVMGTDTITDPSQVDQFFDLNGNLKSMEHLETLSRDYRNMISKAAKPKRDDGTQDVEYYIYNSGGNRVRKITVFQDRVEEKIYLDGVEIKRITQGGVLKLERWDHHVMDDTKRIAVINTWMKDLTARETEKPLTYVIDLDTGEKIDPDTGLPFVPVVKTRYQYGNHLGSASLELDKTGAFVSYQEYFPFGGTSYTVGEVSSEYRFTGKELDEFTGLYYFGARYYASWIGRWCSADPKRENEDGINLYAYCRNNPVLLTDPDGMTAMAAAQIVGYGGQVMRDAQSTGHPGVVAAAGVLALGILIVAGGFKVAEMISDRTVPAEEIEVPDIPDVIAVPKVGPWPGTKAPDRTKTPDRTKAPDVTVPVEEAPPVEETPPTGGKKQPRKQPKNNPKNKGKRNPAPKPNPKNYPRVDKIRPPVGTEPPQEDGQYDYLYRAMSWKEYQSIITKPNGPGLVAQDGPGGYRGPRFLATNPLYLLNEDSFINGNLADEYVIFVQFQLKKGTINSMSMASVPDTKKKDIHKYAKEHHVPTSKREGISMNYGIYTQKTADTYINNNLVGITPFWIREK